MYNVKWEQFQIPLWKVAKQRGSHPPSKWRQKFRAWNYHLSDQKYNYYLVWNFQEKEYLHKKDR